MKLEWSGKNQVGVKAFDNAHKEMAHIISQLIDKAEQGAGKDACLPLLDQLISKAESHFAEEEKELEKRNYKELLDHEDEHRNLINELKELRARISGGGAELSREMAEFMANWLNVHVSETDMRYKDIFKKEEGQG